MWSNIKKKWPLLLICLFLISALLYMMFHHYTVSSGKDLISTLETSLLDLRFRIRGAEKPKSKVAVLAIDEKSIQQFKSWPFSRKYYAQALDNLKQLDVKWIGFDAVFSEPQAATISDVANDLSELALNAQEWNLSEIKEKIKNIENQKDLSIGDRNFAESIQKFQNIVLGYFYFQTEREVELGGRSENALSGFEDMESSVIQALVLPDKRSLTGYSDAMKAYGIVANLPQINKASSHHAFFSNEADRDAIVRWVTLVRILDGNLIPSLALKTAAESLDRDIFVVFDEGGIESIDLVSRKDESDSLSIPIDPLGRGRVLANHRGPGRTFQHFSLADAYNNTFTDEEKEYLKGSILLLGMTAIGINDQRPNPFDPALDGVENHAAILDNILSKDFMHRPKTIYNIEMLILLLIGLIFCPLMIFSRATFSGLFAAAFLVGYYYFDQYYWFGKGIWAYIGVPFIEIIGLFITITLYKYVTEEKERKKVKGAFSLYLSPDVIEQVLDNPDNLQLGGTRKELTVFFSDVRSFTTISESLTPEKLCVFMNEYFTPMTSIILRSKGVLDKYIGDAIMAFWGAPIPLPDQADVACDSAVQMLFALEKLQEDFKKKGFPRCDIGIGLNTGLMSVGNMGSDERFCYTVMGDAVNLGSRLEGLTKEYGIKVMVSEFTIAKLTKKHHFYRDLDDIRVKGKNEPIKVFDLMRPDLLPKESDIRELIQLFAEGRKHYRTQDWDQALKYFQQCLKLRENDGPSLVYQERILEYKIQPKIENWDGVYTFTHK